MRLKFIVNDFGNKLFRIMNVVLTSSCVDNKIAYIISSRTYFHFIVDDIGHQTIVSHPPDFTRISVNVTS